MKTALAYSNERRADERYLCRSPLEWGYFNRREHHDARMVNFSLGGACLETTHSLIIGSTVMMRVEEFRLECRAECRQGVRCPWLRSMALGEVKWCRDRSEPGRPRFEVGLKFHVSEH